MNDPTHEKSSASLETETKKVDIDLNQNDRISIIVIPVAAPVDEFEDNSNVPQLSYFSIFWLFLTKFGILAFGGPVAQIAYLKDRFVIDEQWITIARFNRVFAVYQILPGPSAAELCMFFGCLAGGRIGGIVAGLGFILPGFIGMVLASYLYVTAGFGNPYVDASFRALKPVVAAIMFRAVHKITDHAFISHNTKKINPYLAAFAFLTAINSALRINWFISFGVYGLINMLLARQYYIPSLIIFILQYVAYAIYVVFKGVPPPVSIALGIARTPDLLHLFILGLIAGLLSFGGSYTAIPFIRAEAVLLGGWLPARVFIDCIAIAHMVPSPLSIFATFVGFQGGYTHGGLGSAFAGATVITLGIFFPCFLFTIAGHHVLEKMVRNKFLSAFFDGISGAIVGVIAIVVLDFLKESVGSSTSTSLVAQSAVPSLGQNAIAAVVYVLSLAVLYRFSHRLTAMFLVLAGALAGQFLFLET